MPALGCDAAFNRSSYAVDWGARLVSSTGFRTETEYGVSIKTLESLKNGELEEYSAFERCLVETLLSPTSDVSKCAALMAKIQTKCWIGHGCY